MSRRGSRSSTRMSTEMVSRASISQGMGTLEDEGGFHIAEAGGGEVPVTESLGCCARWYCPLLVIVLFTGFGTALVYLLSRYSQDYRVKRLCGIDGFSFWETRKDFGNQMGVGTCLAELSLFLPLFGMLQLYSLIWILVQLRALWSRFFGEGTKSRDVRGVNHKWTNVLRVVTMLVIVGTLMTANLQMLFGQTDTIRQKAKPAWIFNISYIFRFVCWILVLIVLFVHIFVRYEVSPFFIRIFLLLYGSYSVVTRFIPMDRPPGGQTPEVARIHTVLAVLCAVFVLLYDRWVRKYGVVVHVDLTSEQFVDGKQKQNIGKEVFRSIFFARALWPSLLVSSVLCVTAGILQVIAYDSLGEFASGAFDWDIFWGFTTCFALSHFLYNFGELVVQLGGSTAGLLIRRKLAAHLDSLAPGATAQLTSSPKYLLTETSRAFGEDLTLGVVTSLYNVAEAITSVAVLTQISVEMFLIELSLLFALIVWQLFKGVYLSRTVEKKYQQSSSELLDSAETEGFDLKATANRAVEVRKHVTTMLFLQVENVLIVVTVCVSIYYGNELLVASDITLEQLSSAVFVSYSLVTAVAEIAAKFHEVATWRMVALYPIVEALTLGASEAGGPENGFAIRMKTIRTGDGTEPFAAIQSA